jgi:hypothetical protein
MKNETERVDSFLRNWNHLAKKYNMEKQEYLSVTNGIRHIMKGIEKNETSAGDIILHLDTERSRGG